MLDVHRLRVFRSVVASGSIQAAATNLGYTPSAVSQHVSALQRETGLTLISRVGRGISPTAAGRTLAAQVDGLLSRLGEVAPWSVTCGPAGPGPCRSHTSPRSAPPGCPRWWSALLAEYPGVRLDLSLREDVPTDPAERPDLQIAVEQVGIERPGLVGAPPARRPVRGRGAADDPLAEPDRGRPGRAGRPALGRQRLRPRLVSPQPDRGGPRGRFQSAVPRRGTRLPDGDRVRPGRHRHHGAARARGASTARRRGRGPGGLARPRSARSSPWCRPRWRTRHRYEPRWPSYGGVPGSRPQLEPVDQRRGRAVEMRC